MNRFARRLAWALGCPTTARGAALSFTRRLIRALAAPHR